MLSALSFPLLAFTDSLFKTTPQPNTHIKTYGNDLFNSNISSQISYTAFSGGTTNLLAQGYRYDQLNRLIGSKADPKADGTFTVWTPTSSGLDSMYLERLSYDANGNIRTLRRTAHRRTVGATTVGLDILSYNYPTANDFYGVAKKTSNKLGHITDTDVNDTGIDDITSQAASNYLYDAKGRMIKDVSGNVDQISWTAYDKVREVTRLASKPRLKFTYDAFGRRVSKTVLASTTDSTQNKTTYYVYDASGNVMASYLKEFTSQSAYKYTLTDEYVYGQERVGSYQNGNVVYNGGTQTTTISKGLLSLELQDHLGNVRGVVTGAKAGTAASVVSLADYYPFGMQMPIRRQTPAAYRYGFNGKEKDIEPYGEGNEYDYGFRMYDPRIARFQSADQFAPGFAWYSPYQYAGNMPISCIDLDGLEEVNVAYSLSNKMFGVPKLKSSEWNYFDRDPIGYQGSFATAAKNNTNSLKHDVYEPVFQIHSYYQWAAHEIDKGRSNIKFFHAAADVTGFFGVGGGYHLDPFVIGNDAENALAGVNAMLMEKNMKVIKDILDGKEDLKTKSGKQWSMEYVTTEQGYVEQYLIDFPMSDKALDDINTSLNAPIYQGLHPEFSMARQEVGRARLDFSQRSHREAIGRALVTLQYTQSKGSNGGGSVSPKDFKVKPRTGSPQDNK